MRLLIVTQAVDTEDTYLGFFVRWIDAIAARYESIEVVCLYEGVYTLPSNVTVHSLGKDRGIRGRWRYALGFLVLIWRLRGRYDHVFVHMNEEYVLIGGLVWKLLRKPVYLWRNHYAGSWRTWLAAQLSRRVFYTSEHSYTARFRNACRMPVGVDTERFKEVRTAPQNSVLFFGRFSASKRPDLLIAALALLVKRGVPFTASFYGSALPEDAAYRASVIESARDLPSVRFFEGVPHREAPRIFAAHEVYVNLAASGMFDKMLFEAAASGTKAIARSEDWRQLAGEVFYIPSDSAEAIADAIERVRSVADTDLGEVVRKNSLDALAVRLREEMA